MTSTSKVMEPSRDGPWESRKNKTASSLQRQPISDLIGFPLQKLVPQTLLQAHHPVFCIILHHSSLDFLFLLLQILVFLSSFMFPFTRCLLKPLYQLVLPNKKEMWCKQCTQEQAIHARTWRRTRSLKWSKISKAQPVTGIVASMRQQGQGPLAQHPIWQKCEPHWDRTNWVQFFGSWVRCSKLVEFYKVGENKFAALCAQMFDDRHFPWCPDFVFSNCSWFHIHREIPQRFQTSLSMSFVKLLQPDKSDRMVDQNVESAGTATCKATSVSARRPGNGLVCKAKIIS